MATLLPFALQYADQQLSVIPLIGKRPPEKFTYYQTHIATPKQIQFWWRMHRSANIGIVTGAVSKLVVVDYDVEARTVYPESKELLRKHLGDSFVTSKTGKGFHAIIKTDGAGEIRNIKVAKRDKKGLIETRGEGGYIVAPPSIHPDYNTPYEFTNCRRINDLDVVDGDSVKALLRDLRERFHHEPEEDQEISFDRPEHMSNQRIVVENLQVYHSRLIEKQVVRVSLAGEGTRHTTLLSASGVLASHGVSSEVIYRVLFATSEANGYLDKYGAKDAARTIGYGIKNAELVCVEEDPFVHLGVF